MTLAPWSPVHCWKRGQSDRLRVGSPAGTPATLRVARGLPLAADLDPFGVPEEMQDAFDMQEDVVRDVSRHRAAL